MSFPTASVRAEFESLMAFSGMNTKTEEQLMLQRIIDSNGDYITDNDGNSIIYHSET